MHDSINRTARNEGALGRVNIHSNDKSRVQAVARVRDFDDQRIEIGDRENVNRKEPHSADDPPIPAAIGAMGTRREAASPFFSYSEP